jgi:hypothetical protein
MTQCGTDFASGRRPGWTGDEESDMRTSQLLLALALTACRAAPPATDPSDEWPLGLPVVTGAGTTGNPGRFVPLASDRPDVALTDPGADIRVARGAWEYRTMCGASMAVPHGSAAPALHSFGRGTHELGDAASVVEALPDGRKDSSLFDPSSRRGDASADGRHVSARRTRLMFHTDSGRRRPPPRALSLEASRPLAFDVETESWVHVGRCREAPCRLSVSVDPSLLGFGAHEGSLVLHPHDGSADLKFTVILLVGVGADEASFIEAGLGGRGVPTRPPPSSGTVPRRSSVLPRSQCQLHPMLLPQLRHLKQAPLRTVM